MKKGSKKFTSTTSSTEQVSNKQLEQAYKVIAFSRMKIANVTSLEEIDVEANRIERCVEFNYAYTDHDSSFADFATQFLKENFKELVFGTQFNGNYLDDLQDPTTEREYFSPEFSMVA